MQALVLTLHVIACIILILVVLLQSGKEGMGVIFGGGSSTVFGSSGAGGLLTKITTFVAVMFLVTSLAYNIITSNKVSSAKSILMDMPEASAPAAAPSAPENLGVEIEKSAPADPDQPAQQ